MALWILIVLRARVPLIWPKLKFSDLGSSLSLNGLTLNNKSLCFKRRSTVRREIDSLGNDIVIAELFNGEIELLLNDLEEHIKMLEYKRQKLSGGL